jgi:imidazolonepropionase
VIEADFALRNAGLLATLAGGAPRCGPALREIGALPDAALAATGGRIVWVGADRDFASAVALAPKAVVLDAEGACVVPGFVDPHTHACFAGDRDDEIERRLAGASYAEIAAGWGGIVRSVGATRAASKRELAEGLLRRLDEMLACGTTSVEVKSGYGLETAAEVRSLEAIRLAAEHHPITLVPTFLGAHEVPDEHRADRRRYVELLVREMIPDVAGRGLAVFCDVFCEQGVFSVAESRRILEAAYEAGMQLRIHADELTWTGGAELAGELGARSADHLVFVSDAGMRALADAACVGTVLPAATFYLRLPRYAPARAMIDAGVALASPPTPTRAAACPRRCPSRWQWRASRWVFHSRRRSWRARSTPPTPSASSARSAALSSANAPTSWCCAHGACSSSCVSGSPRSAPWSRTVASWSARAAAWHRFTLRLSRGASGTGRSRPGAASGQNTWSPPSRNDARRRAISAGRSTDGE